MGACLKSQQVTEVPKSDCQPGKQASGSTSFQLILYYFQEFSGRADAAMLLLEDLGVQYSMSTNFRGILQDHPECFAVPVLEDGTTLLNQSAAIVLYLGQKYGICGPPGRLADVVRQSLNCEDAFADGYRSLNFGRARDNGIRWARESGRFSKWLFTLQAPLLEKGRGPFLFGQEPTFADYHLLNVLRMLGFCFPQTLQELLSKQEFKPLSQWKAAMEGRPRIASYLTSQRNRPLGYGAVQAVDKGARGGLSGTVPRPRLEQKISSDEIVIYYYDGFSSRADAAMLLLEDVGAKYSMSADFRELLQDNPACFAVPVLGDGTNLISQTAAIMLYLGQKFSLCGPDGKLSVVLRQALNCEDAFMEGYKVLNFGKTPKAGSQWAKESGRFAKWLLAFQAPLHEEGGGPFLFGSNPTFADYHTLNTIRQFEFVYPKATADFLASPELVALRGWRAAMEARPGVAQYLVSPRNRPMLYDAIRNVG